MVVLRGVNQKINLVRFSATTLNNLIINKMMVIISWMIGSLLGLIVVNDYYTIRENYESKKESNFRRECEYYSAKLDMDDWINEQHIKLQKRLAKKDFILK